MTQTGIKEELRVAWLRFTTTHIRTVVRVSLALSIIVAWGIMGWAGWFNERWRPDYISTLLVFWIALEFMPGGNMAKTLIAKMMMFVAILGLYTLV